MWVYSHIATCLHVGMGLTSSHIVCLGMGLLHSHCHMSRYGFDYGCIHVVMMSTEHDFRNASKQYAFLTDHLKSVNRTKTPWLIFGGHR